MDSQDLIATQLASIARDVADTRERVIRIESREAAAMVEHARDRELLVHLDERVTSIEVDHEAERRSRRQLAAVAGGGGIAAIADLLHRIFGGS